MHTWRGWWRSYPSFHVATGVTSSSLVFGGRLAQTWRVQCYHVLCWIYAELGLRAEHADILVEVLDDVSGASEDDSV
jgi:hypothetical protein